MTALELWSYTCKDASSPELAHAAAQAGMAYITTTPRQYMRDGGAKGDLRQRIEDAGAKVSFLDGLCSVFPGAPKFSGAPTNFNDAHEASLEDCLSIASQLGAHSVNVIHIGGKQMPLEPMAEAFATACKRARESGINLGIEFLPGTGIPDLATAAAIVRAAGAPNGSIVFDSWHWARFGGHLQDFDDATIAMIGGVQISDRSPEQDTQPYVSMQGRKLPGQGALPLAAILARIVKAHPDLAIGAEVLDQSITDAGPEAAARQIADALRSVLDEAKLLNKQN